MLFVNFHLYVINPPSILPNGHPVPVVVPALSPEQYRMIFNDGFRAGYQAAYMEMHRSN